MQISNDTIDIYHMFKTIAGHDINDSNTINQDIKLDFNQKNVDKIKIGYSEKLFNELQPGLKEKYLEVINFLKNQNFTVENIDIKNPMRVVRAWEVFHETGKSLKKWQSETEPAILPISECHPLVINPGKADLDKKIRLRFEQMIKMGALDEAKKNLVNWNENSLASKAIGASELIAHLKGELSINQAIEKASIATRQYAKRQKTWIKTRMTDWDDITNLTL